MRRLGGDRAGEIRITRFLRNPSVTIAEMIATAFGRTEAACAGRDVLAVQDTTATRPSAGGRGGFLHATIAVDAASGGVPGALDAQFLERSEGGGASRLRRAFEDRQSVRWLVATRRAAELRGVARVTVAADREADIFELFAHRPTHGVRPCRWTGSGGGFDQGGGSPRFSSRSNGMTVAWADRAQIEPTRRPRGPARSSYSIP